MTVPYFRFMLKYALVVSVLSGVFYCKKPKIDIDQSGLYANGNGCDISQADISFGGTNAKVNVNYIKVGSGNIPPEYGVKHYRISQNSGGEVREVIDKLRSHIISNQKASRPQDFAPQHLVDKFKNEIDNWVTMAFQGKYVLVSNPVVRVVAPNFKKVGGIAHVDSKNVPKDFFGEFTMTSGPNPEPEKIRQMLREDIANATTSTKLNAEYQNIWIPIINNVDDKSSGLVFGKAITDVKELQDSSKFAVSIFEGNGRKIESLNAQPHSSLTQDQTWIKPYGLQPMDYDYLMFPTRTSVHSAVDSVSNVTTLQRASIEVRIAIFPGN